MKNHFLELFSALVLTNTPPLITPIFAIFYHPFSFLSPSVRSSSYPLPYPSTSLSVPAPIGRFRHFQPFKFPLKIPSYFYREFSPKPSHFPSDFSSKLTYFSNDF
nr:MAG TPA: hypothetical protein [Caudoviricetes sp.]